MHKVVTYGSAEYYELLGLGWFVAHPISPSTVLMAHEGTVYGVGIGMPASSSNPIVWTPQWGGTPGSTVAHDWVEIMHSGTTPQNEVNFLYQDLLSYDASYGDLYHVTKIDVKRSGMVWWSEIFGDRYTDMLFEFNWRTVTPFFDQWFTLASGVNGPVTVRLQYLTPGAPGPIQYRITFTPPGTIEYHSTWTGLINAYIASGAH